jgi:hypothetical protein
MQWVIFYNLKCPIGLLGQVYIHPNTSPSAEELSSYDPRVVFIRRRAYLYVSFRADAGWEYNNST